MPLTELPFGLPGRVFRSPMPFAFEAQPGETFRRYQEAQVSTVVLLAGDEECERRAGRNLRQFYTQQGLNVIHLPVPDFGAPDLAELEQSVQAALDAANRGENLAIHCYAGLGRTGMFAACMAKRQLGLSGEAAIRWVRTAVPGAVESTQQVRLVHDF